MPENPKIHFAEGKEWSVFGGQKTTSEGQSRFADKVQQMERNPQSHHHTTPGG
jgi:hypothetical protein